MQLPCFQYPWKNTTSITSAAPALWVALILAVRFMWCDKVSLISLQTVQSESYHGSSLNHCDIYTSISHPYMRAHTHSPYHPPTHSIRAIISPVAGSNKTVTQGRCLETLAAKSHYLTQEAQRQRRRNQNTTVKVEGVFIWTASRGLTEENSVFSLPSREEQECRHTFCE